MVRTVLVGIIVCNVGCGEWRGHSEPPQPTCDIEESPALIALATESLPHMREILSVFLGDGAWIRPTMSLEEASVQMENAVRAEIATLCSAARLDRLSPTAFTAEFGSICKVASVTDLFSGRVSALATNVDGVTYLDFSMDVKVGALTYSGAQSIEIANPTMYHVVADVATDDMSTAVPIRFNGRAVDDGAAVVLSGTGSIGAVTSSNCVMGGFGTGITLEGLRREVGRCHATAGRVVFHADFKCCDAVAVPSRSIQDAFVWSTATATSDSVEETSSRRPDGGSVNVALFGCTAR